jgi:hypothetical protein
MQLPQRPLALDRMIDDRRRAVAPDPAVGAALLGLRHGPGPVDEAVAPEPWM